MDVGSFTALQQKMDTEYRGEIFMVSAADESVSISNSVFLHRRGAVGFPGCRLEGVFNGQYEAETAVTLSHWRTGTRPVLHQRSSRTSRSSAALEFNL